MNSRKKSQISHEDESHTKDKPEPDISLQNSPTPFSRRKVGIRMILLLAAGFAAIWILARSKYSFHQPASASAGNIENAAGEEPGNITHALTDEQFILATSSPSEAEIKIAEASDNLPQRVSLPVPYLNQMPELPTGCESIALTMALRFLGYSLEKTTIADRYLVYSEDNIAAGYIGDPREYDGGGVFPPGLTNSANLYLISVKATQRAHDLTETSLYGLLPYVAAGYPVLLWVTMEYDMPDFSGDEIDYRGREYYWYWNEHCAVLTGYDLTEGEVYLQDPLQGSVIMSMEDLEEIYDEIGRFSLAVY